MKRKEKIITGIWLGSLIVILLMGIYVSLRRPSKEIIEANREVMTTSAQIRRYYSNRPDYWGLNSEEAVKLKLYSGYITNNQIMNSLNKRVVIGSDINGNPVMPGQRSFMIGYLNLNQKECIELASFHWKEEDKLGLISMSIFNDEGKYEFSWGDKGLPLSRSQTKKYCRQNNSLMWFFE